MAKKQKNETTVLVPVVVTAIQFAAFTTYHYAVTRDGNTFTVAFSDNGVGGTLNDALNDAKKKCHKEADASYGADNMEVLGYFSTVTLSNGTTFNTVGGRE